MTPAYDRQGRRWPLTGEGSGNSSAYRTAGSVDHSVLFLQQHLCSPCDASQLDQWTGSEKRKNYRSGARTLSDSPASKRRTRPSLVAHAPARLYRIDHVDKRRVPVHRLAITRTVFDIPLDSRVPKAQPPTRRNISPGFGFVPWRERRRQPWKRPKWLRESCATKSDDLKKARRETDQRMKQQDTQKITTGRVSEKK